MLSAHAWLACRRCERRTLCGLLVEKVHSDGCVLLRLLAYSYDMQSCSDITGSYSICPHSARGFARQLELPSLHVPPGIAAAAASASSASSASSAGSSADFSAA